MCQETLHTRLRNRLFSSVASACAQCVLSLAPRRSVRFYDVTPYFARAVPRSSSLPRDDHLLCRFPAERGFHKVPFPCSLSLCCMSSGICTCSRDQPDDFNGYGYFHVRLYCAGLRFQANIVEEYVPLSASRHIFAGLKRTRDQRLCSGLMSGQLSSAITGLMLLTFMATHPCWAQVFCFVG